MTRLPAKKFGLREGVGKASFPKMNGGREKFCCQGDPLPSAIASGTLVLVRHTRPSRVSSMLKFA